MVNNNFFTQPSYPTALLQVVGFFFLTDFFAFLVSSMQVGKDTLCYGPDSGVRGNVPVGI